MLLYLIEPSGFIIVERQNKRVDLTNNDKRDIEKFTDLLQRDVTVNTAINILFAKRDPRLESGLMCFD